MNRPLLSLTVIQKFLGDFLKIFALVLFMLCFSQIAAAERVDCSIVKKAVRHASDIRELKVKREVPCKARSRSEVESYLRETILRKIPRERVDREGYVYEMLGLIPLGYDYFNQMIQLYSEELGGYYDPDRAYYAMADWMDPAMQMPIAVHELTHALQDQYFNLNKLVDHANQNGDTLLARSALAEGDATAVMLDYDRRLKDRPGVATEVAGTLLMFGGSASAVSSDNLRKYPAAMKAVLVFPYVNGFSFVHALLRKGGYAEVNKAYERPPSSTKEILHPELYIAGVPSFEVVETPKAPKALREAFSEPVFTDTIGEFLISTLLASWVSPVDASAAARSWGGDTIALFEDEANSRRLLLWDTRWETDVDAEQFYETLIRAYEKRFLKKGEQAGQQTRRRTFKNTEVGDVRVSKTGRDVRAMFGPLKVKK